MKPELGEGDKIGYSKTERELFSMLPLEPSRISSRDLTKRKYRGRSIPFFGIQIIGGTMRMLSRKVEINREPFRIAKTERRGPHPIFWSIERRRA